MIYAPIDNVKYGQILARNIYTNDGSTLLKSGVVLSISLLTRLRNMGVSSIYIKDDRFEDVEIEDIVSEETRRETISNLSVAMQSIQGGKDFNVTSLKKSADYIISEITQNKNILLNLTDIRTKDNSLFVHSMNCCMMSVLMGLHLNINKIQLGELAIGALLHDVGKVLKLDNEEDHAWKGFDVLRKKHDFNIMTAHIALQHHEHIDGSGYPRAVKGDEIPLFAKIVAVADYFDTLLAKENAKPYEACEEVSAYATSRFELDIVNVFLKSIAIYPTGSWVTLTTGEVGVVIKQHSGLPTRPVIRVFTASNHVDELDLDSPDMKDIDLAIEKTVFVKNANMD